MPTYVHFRTRVDTWPTTAAIHIAISPAIGNGAKISLEWEGYQIGEAELKRFLDQLYYRDLCNCHFVFYQSVQ